jgi:hypothetical protein
MTQVQYSMSALSVAILVWYVRGPWIPPMSLLAAQQLSQEERLAVGPGEHPAQRLVGLAAQHVMRDLYDRGLVEGAQPDLDRAHRVQPADGFPGGIWQFPGAQCQQPADRVRGQPLRQRDHRAGGGGIRRPISGEAEQGAGVVPEDGPGGARLEVVLGPVVRVNVDPHQVSL